MPSKNIAVVYHGACNDGIQSANIVLEKNENVKYVIPYNHVDEVDFSSITEEFSSVTIFFVDIVPPISQMEIIKTFNHVTILDHHESNINSFADYSFTDNFTCIFDMTRSGCQITEDFFNERDGKLGEERFWLTDYIGDRDIWTFKLPMSKEINASIWRKGIGYKTEQHILKNKTHFDLTNLNIEEYKADGIVYLQSQQYEMDQDLKRAIPCIFTTPIGEYRIWVLFTSRNGSEVGNYACSFPFSDGTMPDFVAICSIYKKTKWSISLRNIKDEINLSKISVSVGGGGHKDASAFRCEYNDLFKFLSFISGQDSPKMEKCPSKQYQIDRPDIHEEVERTYFNIMRYMSPIVFIKYKVFNCICRVVQDRFEQDDFNYLFSLEDKYGNTCKKVILYTFNPFKRVFSLRYRHFSSEIIETFNVPFVDFLHAFINVTPECKINN